MPDAKKDRGDMTDREDQGTGQVPQKTGGSDRHDPQYGQRIEPDYGQRADQYPGWDPYVFGRDDQESESSRSQADSSHNPATPGGSVRPGQYSPPGQVGSGAVHSRHRIINGVDLDDPAQNPSYGHWDPYAIISFIMALFLPVPILSAILGGISMYRTRILHMKGFGLALAAVIINVLYTLTWLWMISAGVSMDDLLQQMFQSTIPSAPAGTGDTGGGNGVSA